ncbi:MAG: TrkH family potassium uptake protein [Nitrospinota bacterium]
MNISSVLRSLGFIALLLGAALVIPVAISAVAGGPDLVALAASVLISGAVGGCLLYFGGREEMAARDGFAVVTGTWLLVSFVGAFPYWLSGTIPSYTDAFFEAISGFTTTGATVVANIEDLPAGILFWRSFTQWLGGMGIIVLTVAFLPLFGVGGLQVLNAEAPGPTFERLVPRLRETAKLLWGIYLLLSVSEVLLLLAGGMPPFEAVLHTFSTMATGGFSPKDASIAAYSSPYLQWVIILFMGLAGTSFSLHYFALRGRSLSSYWKNTEFRFYLSMLGAATLVTTLFLLWQTQAGAERAVREAAFQVVAIVTTTGFVTADFELWPVVLQALLLFLMFFGGCSGSTGGGMKHMRLLLLFRHSGAQMLKLIHPRAVKGLLLGERPVTDDVIEGIQSFFFLYLTLWVGGSLALSALGMDLVTGISAAASALGNVGPGLGAVGPADNYAGLPALAKWILSALMLLGRLEIFPVIILLSRETWRR